MGVVTGIDTDGARRSCFSAGLDMTVVDDLLAACERGVVAAMNERDEDPIDD